MKILIIEDERLLAGSIKDLLEIQGFEAEAVYDGETGFTYAGTGIYDLIILDVMMPGKVAMRWQGSFGPAVWGTPHSNAYGPFCSGGSDRRAGCRGRLLSDKAL